MRQLQAGEPQPPGTAAPRLLLRMLWRLSQRLQQALPPQQQQRPQHISASSPQALCSSLLGPLSDRSSRPQHSSRQPVLAQQHGKGGNL